MLDASGRNRTTGALVGPRGLAPKSATSADFRRKFSNDNMCGHWNRSRALRDFSTICRTMIAEYIAIGCLVWYFTVLTVCAVGVLTMYLLIA